jgi:2-amino-4-hydroxy-6-hydroxymethyldihydropteridine diphosphokinase
MITCFIALGSNLDQPAQQLSAAVDALSLLSNSHLQAVSPWYTSSAVGPGDQPDYLNGVVELHTSLPATQLLAQLQRIEDQQLRVRGEHWGPRTLDLDLLLYGQQNINSEQLTVPHPRLQQRNFVLYPLFDLAADLHLPDGTSIRSLVDSCGSDGLVKASASQQYNGHNETITTRGDCSERG